MIIDSHQHLMLPTELQIKKLEEAGVDKAILFCTTPHPEQARTLTEYKAQLEILYGILAGKNSREEDLRRMRENLQALTRVLAQYPAQFWGFGPVPLGRSVAETSLWLQEEILANGLKGVGEFTPGSDEQMEQLSPVFQALTDFPGLPLWVHTFAPVSLTGLRRLMALTARYPSVPVIFGHMGGYHWLPVLEFAQSTPNVYVDLSAAFSPLAVRLAIQALPQRTLFASDAPYGEPRLSRQMVEAVCPSPRVAQRVLGENILALLGG